MMSRHWRIILAGVLLLAAGGLRQAGLRVPVWNVDEAVTFTMAEQILAGEVPYRDAVDQRTPLVPYVQAAVFKAFGHWNLPAQHTVLAVMIGFAAILVWRTARRFGDEPAGVAAALWFTLLGFMLPSVRDTMAAHTGWYLMFCSCLGFWCLARAWPGGSVRWSLASGAAFGLSFLAKQPGLLDFGAALTLVALGAWRQPARRKPLAGAGLGLLAGFAVPVLGMFGYLAAHGAWADFVYYTWTYNNSLYVPEVPLLRRWATIRVPFEQAWQWHPLAVVAGLAAIIPLLRRAWVAMDAFAWLILGWCAAGLISTTLSGRGFTHYSIQLIPGLSLACGWTTARLWEQTRPWRARGRSHDLAMQGLAGLVGLWLLVPAGQRLRGLKLPAGGDDDIARLVQRHSAPGERIHVWGYNPEIYAEARRLPATRFLYDTFLTGLIPWTNLDPGKDTGYAIVPGAWTRYEEDWARHPPALVVDSRELRGFLKYPLEQQHPLWEHLQGGYAEIETETVGPLGYRLFKRLDPATIPPAAPAAFRGAGVQMTAPETSVVADVRVKASAPAGTLGLELLVDGRAYASLSCPPERPPQTAFTIRRDSLPPGIHRLQAVARSPAGSFASAEHELRIGPQFAVATEIGGPPLEFDGRLIAALEASAHEGRPIRPKPEDPTHWDAHAPSRLVYPRLPEMNSLTFSYGIEMSALQRESPNGTDGIEALVLLEDAAGQRRQIYDRRFDRESGRRAGGRVVDYVALPAGGPGRIILLLTPGPLNDTAYDWSYWTWLKANRGPLQMDIAGAPLQPVRIAAAADARQAEFNGHLVTVMPAPAVAEFAAPAGLAELTGSFGLLDESWLGADQTDGADFKISLQKPDGTEIILLQRSLQPASMADDRGVRPFRIPMPAPSEGMLRFQIRPHGAGHRAADQAFWGELAGLWLRTGLAAGGGEIPAGPGTEARFGFANADEDGRPCLFAHAPATLAYPWREGMTRLTGSFGIMRGAYTGGHTTDGVVFVVEAEDALGMRRELFRRHLSPAERDADGGDQVLSVAIPPVTGGRILLRTAAAPSGNLDRAWSYWRDLHVTP